MLIYVPLVRSAPLFQDVSTPSEKGPQKIVFTTTSFSFASAQAVWNGTGPCVKGSLPAIKIIFKSALEADHSSCSSDVLITYPQYSFPPLVRKANSFSEITSRSVVSGLTNRM